VVRGLDPEETSAFLATVADEYEAVLVDNKQLRERILELDEKLTEYRSMEKTLRDTLMTAERVLDEAKENAHKESNLIVKEAELRSQQLVESFHRQASDLRQDIIGLHKDKEAYLARFKALAEAQIQFIENHQSDFADLDRRLLTAADSLGQMRQSEPAADTAEPTQQTSRTQVRKNHQRDEWRNYQPVSSGARAWHPHKPQPLQSADTQQAAAPGQVEPVSEERGADVDIKAVDPGDKLPVLEGVARAKEAADQDGIKHSDAEEFSQELSKL
jgi:cell division initiation protein